MVHILPHTFHTNIQYLKHSTIISEARSIKRGERDPEKRSCWNIKARILQPPQLSGRYFSCGNYNFIFYLCMVFLVNNFFIFIIGTAFRWFYDIFSNRKVFLPTNYMYIYGKKLSLRSIWKLSLHTTSVC